MKKLLIIIVLVVISASSLLAQNPFPVGGKQFNAGVGLSGWGIPIYGGLDFGLHDDISLGIQASFSSYNESWDARDYHRSIFGLIGNANYHFNRILEIPRDWDFYAGLNIGFYFWSKPDGYKGDNSSEAGLGAQIGGRYYLNDRLGLNLEFTAGNAISGGKFGISYLF